MVHLTISLWALTIFLSIFHFFFKVWLAVQMQTYLKGCFVLVVAFIFLSSGALVLVHSTANLFARFANLTYIMITRLLLGIYKESKVFGLCIGSQIVQMQLSLVLYFLSVIQDHVFIFSSFFKKKLTCARCFVLVFILPNFSML